MKPKYAEDIVVAIKDNGLYEWYILSKEIIYLDYIKWIESYNRIGFNLPIEAPDRFDILVVNNDTKTEFLSNIYDHRISTADLRKMLSQETESFAKFAYKPAVLIDFDNQIFISDYYETESFEDFIPNGWKGFFKNFSNEIPLEEKFWLSENGSNLIGELS